MTGSTIAVSDILTKLNSKGIALSVQGGKLISKAPKGTITQELVDLIKVNRDYLIEYLASIQSVGMHVIPQTERAKDDQYPLSYAQQRLWFLESIQGPSGMFNIPIHLTFNGSFDKYKFVTAINRIIDRHEPLRTRFSDCDGESMQVVDTEKFLQVSNFDYSDERDGLEKIYEELNASAFEPFDLSNDLMLRCHIYAAPNQSTHVLLVLHHICADGWSLDLLLHELDVFYSQASDKDVVALPVHYRDYALWQKRQRDRGMFDESLAFWKKQLAGIAHHHSLPLDNIRTKDSHQKTNSITHTLSRNITKRIMALGSECDCTGFMLGYALFTLLISRWSGECDTVIGTPVAGRVAPQTHHLIGFFVNSLILRHKINDDLSLYEHLQEIRSTVIDALSHEHYPFDLLVDHLKPTREVGIHPIFQIAYSYVPHLQRQHLATDVEITYLAPEVAKYDIYLQIEELEHGEWELCWEYNTSVFRQETIETLATAFEALIEKSFTKPDKPLRCHSLAGPQHLKRICNTVARDRYEDSRTLDSAFDTVAEERSGAVALIFGKERLRYGELALKSKHMAGDMTVRGIRPGDTVALLCHRGIDQIVGILAVLRAGAAYLPIDPATPKDRIAYMLDDGNVISVLGHTDLLGGLDDDTIQCWDIKHPEQWAPIHRSVENFYENRYGTAYVIYTSGSTGRPKGVEVGHHQVLRLFHATSQSFSFSSEDRWTLFHSVSFDFSVWEIWGALLHGGVLDIVPFNLSRDADQFLTYLQENRITVLNQTPTAFYSLLKALENFTETLFLRYVIFGGEALDPRRLLSWFQKTPAPAQLINMYGITETTVHVSHYILREEDCGSTRSPIGRPLNDLSVVVCDQHMNLQPIGAVGELLVGGDGLARGYRNLETLTEKRFIEINGWGALSGRYYRSGDLGRWSCDGNLEYLGRIDQQVKIRGFRIELAEIEKVIEEVNVVESARVLRQDDHNGEAVLVAYLKLAKAAEGDAPWNDQLQGIWMHMSSRLPSYMVVTRFHRVTNFPLTANGKLDRRQIPPLGEAMTVTAAYKAPATELEKKVTRIWQTTIGCPRVGMDDNFFILGGDSIKALQVVQLMQKDGFRITVRDLFDCQSVEQLLAKVALTGSDQQNAEVPFHLLDALLARISIPKAHPGSYPLSSAQAFMVEKSRQYPGAYQPAHLLELFDGAMDDSRLLAVIHGLLNRHPTLRHCIFNDASRWWQCPLSGGSTISLPLPIDAPGLDEARRLVKHKFSAFKQCPISFSEHSALLHIDIYSWNDRHRFLMIRTHHALEDGWGFTHFINELVKYYNTFDNGLDEFEPQAMVTKETIALELEAERSPESKAYWKRYLVPKSTPKNDLHGVADRDVQAQQYIEFDCSNDRPWFNDLISTYHVSFKSVLLHAFSCSLKGFHVGEYIDVVTNGRSERLSDPLGAIGLFWKFLPVKIGTENVPATLQCLHDTLLSHEQFLAYPLDKIASATIPSRMVAFNYINFHHYGDTVLESGLQVEVLAAHDPFHHPLKLTVLGSHDRGELKARIDFCPTQYTVEAINVMRDTFTKNLKELATQ